MSIQQFNASYIPTEDRVLLRFNTSDSSEYRLWLTRKMTLRLLDEGAERSVAQIARSPLPAAEGVALAPTPAVARTIDAFQQEALKQQLDMKTEYRAANKLPLGAEPVLIIDTTIEILDGGVIDLRLELANKMKLNLKQPVSMLNSLRLLMQQMVETAGWSLPAPAQAAPPMSAPGSSALH